MKVGAGETAMNSARRSAPPVMAAGLIALMLGEVTWQQ